MTSSDVGEESEIRKLTLIDDIQINDGDLWLEITSTQTIKDGKTLVGLVNKDYT